MKLSIVLVFVVSVNVMLACSCDAPSSVLQSFNTSDLIVQAKVLSKTTIPLINAFKDKAFENTDVVKSPFNDQQQHVQKVELEVVKAFKGETVEKVVIFTAISDMVCGYNGFEKGKEFIIYANQSCFMMDIDAKFALDNSYWANKCSRTKPFSQLEAKELNEVVSAQKTFYFSKFDGNSFQEVLDYMETNELEISWEQNNDLLAATKFNEYLSSIEYENALDVGFYMNETGIKQMRFYFKDKSTSRISTQDSPIRVYFQNLDNKMMFQATVHQSNQQDLKITYTYKSKRIIVSHWLDNQLAGYYTEYDENGMSRVEGKYEQQVSEPHKLDVKDSPDIFGAKSADIIVNKKPVKVGTWRYFDEEGNLIKEEKF